MILKRIPNLLTVLRILLIPVIVIAFYFEGRTSTIIAAAIFIFASVTDYLDGMLARALQAQTQLGKVLDPIADKLLVVATLVMLIHFSRAPVIPALLILLREILVSGLRENLSSIDISLPVSNLAKMKTAIQMIAILVLIVGHLLFYPSIWIVIGQILLWIAAVLTLLTGYAYCKAGFKNL